MTSGLVAKPLRKLSPTWWLAALVGSTRSSGVLKETLSNGAVISSSTAITGTAARAGRRMTAVASRPQNGASTLRTEAIPGTRPALTRCPRTVSAAGSTSSAVAAASTVTPTPAYAKDFRK